MSETSEPHVRDSVLAAYLDRSLTPSARALADAHLAGCSSCRDDLVDLSTLLSAAARRRRSKRLARVGVAAAAVLIVAIVPLTISKRSASPDAERVRAKDIGSAAARLAAVSPVDGATLSPDSVRFTWMRAPRDAGYRVTITDAGGVVQWTTDTSDSTVGLPASVHLLRGQTYYWYVDALGGDGRTNATELRRLRIAP